MNCSKSLKLFILVLLTTNVTVAQDIDFVKLTSYTVVRISEGSSVVKVLFEVRDGFHIQSNDPESDSVIPTEMEMNWPRGVTSFEPIFPAAEEMVLEGTDEPLYVFSETVEVSIAISYEEGMLKGEYRVPGKILYQACDHKRCFYPRDLKFNLVLMLD